MWFVIAAARRVLNQMVSDAPLLRVLPPRLPPPMGSVAGWRGTGSGSRALATRHSRSSAIPDSQLADRTLLSGHLAARPCPSGGWVPLNCLRKGAVRYDEGLLSSIPKEPGASLRRQAMQSTPSSGDGDIWFFCIS